MTKKRSNKRGSSCPHDAMKLGPGPPRPGQGRSSRSKNDTPSWWFEVCTTTTLKTLNKNGGSCTAASRPLRPPLAVKNSTRLQLHGRFLSIFFLLLHPAAQEVVVHAVSLVVRRPTTTNAGSKLEPATSSATAAPTALEEEEEDYIDLRHPSRRGHTTSSIPSPTTSRVQHPEQSFWALEVGFQSAVLAPGKQQQLSSFDENFHDGEDVQMQLLGDASFAGVDSTSKINGTRSTTRTTTSSKNIFKPSIFLSLAEQGEIGDFSPPNDDQKRREAPTASTTAVQESRRSASLPRANSFDKVAIKTQVSAIPRVSWQRARTSTTLRGQGVAEQSGTTGQDSSVAEQRRELRGGNANAPKRASSSSTARGEPSAGLIGPAEQSGTTGQDSSVAEQRREKLREVTKYSPQRTTSSTTESEQPPTAEVQAAPTFLPRALSSLPPRANSLPKKEHPTQRTMVRRRVGSLQDDSVAEQRHEEDPGTTTTSPRSSTESRSEGTIAPATVAKKFTAPALVRSTSLPYSSVRRWHELSSRPPVEDDTRSLEMIAEDYFSRGTRLVVRHYDDPVDLRRYHPLYKSGPPAPSLDPRPSTRATFGLESTFEGVADKKYFQDLPGKNQSFYPPLLDRTVPARAERDWLTLGMKWLKYQLPGFREGVWGYELCCRVKRASSRGQSNFTEHTTTNSDCKRVLLPAGEYPVRSPHLELMWQPCRDSDPVPTATTLDAAKNELLFVAVPMSPPWFGLWTSLRGLRARRGGRYALSPRALDDVGLGERITINPVSSAWWSFVEQGVKLQGSSTSRYSGAEIIRSRTATTPEEQEESSGAPNFYGVAQQSKQEVFRPGAAGGASSTSPSSPAYVVFQGGCEDSSPPEVVMTNGGQGAAQDRQLVVPEKWSLPMPILQTWLCEGLLGRRRRTMVMVKDPVWDDSIRRDVAPFRAEFFPHLLFLTQWDMFYVAVEPDLEGKLTSLRASSDPAPPPSDPSLIGTRAAALSKRMVPDDEVLGQVAVKLQEERLAESLWRVNYRRNNGGKIGVLSGEESTARGDSSTRTSPPGQKSYFTGTGLVDGWGREVLFLLRTVSGEMLQYLQTAHDRRARRGGGRAASPTTSTPSESISWHFSDLRRPTTSSSSFRHRPATFSPGFLERAARETSQNAAVAQLVDVKQNQTRYGIQLTYQRNEPRRLFSTEHARFRTSGYTGNATERLTLELEFLLVPRIAASDVLPALLPGGIFESSASRLWLERLRLGRELFVKPTAKSSVSDLETTQARFKEGKPLSPVWVEFLAPQDEERAKLFLPRLPAPGSSQVASAEGVEAVVHELFNTRDGRFQSSSSGALEGEASALLELAAGIGRYYDASSGAILDEASLRADLQRGLLGVDAPLISTTEGASTEPSNDSPPVVNNTAGSTLTTDARAAAPAARTPAAESTTSPPETTAAAGSAPLEVAASPRPGSGNGPPPPQPQGSAGTTSSQLLGASTAAPAAYDPVLPTGTTTPPPTTARSKIVQPEEDKVALTCITLTGVLAFVLLLAGIVVTVFLLRACNYGSSERAENEVKNQTTADVDPSGSTTKITTRRSPRARSAPTTARSGNSTRDHRAAAPQRERTASAQRRLVAASILPKTSVGSGRKADKIRAKQEQTAVEKLKTLQAALRANPRLMMQNKAFPPAGGLQEPSTENVAREAADSGAEELQDPGGPRRATVAGVVDEDSTKLIAVGGGSIFPAPGKGKEVHGLISKKPPGRAVSYKRAVPDKAAVGTIQNSKAVSSRPDRLATTTHVLTVAPKSGVALAPSGQARQVKLNQWGRDMQVRPAQQLQEGKFPPPPRPVPVKLYQWARDMQIEPDELQQGSRPPPVPTLQDGQADPLLAIFPPLDNVQAPSYTNFTFEQRRQLTDQSTSTEEKPLLFRTVDHPTVPAKSSSSSNQFHSAGQEHKSNSNSNSTMGSSSKTTSGAHHHLQHEEERESETNSKNSKSRAEKKPLKKDKKRSMVIPSLSESFDTAWTTARPYGRSGEREAPPSE